MNKERKLCVYAICKNESKFIDRWLDCVSEADYVVVLDTGSTDDSFDKLKSDPRVTKAEQIVFNPFRFDDARNASMELAPEDTDILFCSDLDEVFDKGWTQVIKSRWQDKTWRMHYHYSLNDDANGNPTDIFWNDKIHIPHFYHWKYPVHEVLIPEGGEQIIYSVEKQEGHLVDLGSDFTVHHKPDPDKSRSFYFDLLKLRYDENPNEPYSVFLLGREYANAQDYDTALKYFLETLSLPDVQITDLVQFCCLGYVGDIYSSRKEFDNAILYYNKQLIINKTYREPYLKLAEIYNVLGLYEIAVSYVNTAVKQGYQHFDWTENTKSYTYQVYDILSVAYFYLDEIDKGIENAVRALQYCPLDQRIQRNYLALIDKKKQLK